jgi:AbrB family looped-hinge helix DNA binding protein
MHTPTITSKGQVTIPAKLRRLLDLHPGDALVFEVVDHKIVISKRKNDITAAFGMYRVNKKVTLSNIQKIITS